MDIFTWSIPFVAEKGIILIIIIVTEMLYHIMRVEDNLSDDEVD